MSSFLTAHQHILGYLVPYNDVKDTVKEIRYNQGYTLFTLNKDCCVTLLTRATLLILFASLTCNCVHFQCVKNSAVVACKYTVA